MGAGQRIAKETNKMPALACLPLQSSWFWKTDFPTTPVKDVTKLVNETLIPLNNASCNFILNVAPNPDGLFDDNALAGLKQIGAIWKNEGPVNKLPQLDAPIISANLAKNKPANASWSDDMDIMDFANDDNFKSSWVSNATVKNPWYEVDLGHEIPFNAIVIAEQKANIKTYKLEYYESGVWKPLFNGENLSKIKVHRFKQTYGSKVRILIATYDHQPSIAEFEVYNERR